MPAHRAERLLRPRPGSAAEHAAVLQALQKSGFNMTRAAQLLGVSRATLYRILSRNYIDTGQDFVQQTKISEPSKHR